MLSNLNRRTEPAFARRHKTELRMLPALTACSCRILSTSGLRTHSTVGSQRTIHIPVVAATTIIMQVALGENAGTRTAFNRFNIAWEWKFWFELISWFWFGCPCIWKVTHHKHFNPILYPVHGHMFTIAIYPRSTDRYVFQNINPTRQQCVLKKNKERIVLLHVCMTSIVNDEIKHSTTQFNPVVQSVGIGLVSCNNINFKIINLLLMGLNTF
mmetsp:Transcript_39422/g.80643  ORF Transcript_39422/g.80643 Transcript_39422/m.80643 type:complete len:213 (+) Transcript_39422:143-781(+)